MQPDQLTLSVDAANNGTPANQVYTRYEEFQNRSRYIGDGHTPGARNELGVYRSFPTKTGNFKGVGKTSVKLTQDCVVAGVDSTTSVTAPIILELSFSVPVGVVAAELVEMRQRLLALIDDDSFMDKLNIQLMI